MVTREHPPSWAASLPKRTSHEVPVVPEGTSPFLGCLSLGIPIPWISPWFPGELHPPDLPIPRGVPTHLMNFSKSAAVSGGSYRVTTLWLRRRLSKTSLWRLSSSWWVWNTLGSSEVAERTRSTESLPLPFCSSSCSRCSSVSEWLMVAAVESPLKSAFWAAGRRDSPRAVPQSQALR